MAAAAFLVAEGVVEAAVPEGVVEAVEDGAAVDEGATEEDVDAAATDEEFRVPQWSEMLLLQPCCPRASLG